MADPMKGERQRVARQVLSTTFTDDFKKEVGQGMSVLLEQQGLTMEDIDEVQGSYGKRAPDLKSAARIALEERIAKNYPNWDDTKINNYIQEGTANDFPSDTPQRGMPEDQFPPAEQLESVGEPDYSMPMQEGEEFPPPEQLQSVGVPEGEEPRVSPEPARGGASTGADEKKKKAPHLERMRRMREAFGLDPKY
jgi:hypothetical protein